jgi:iron complex outermembrane recepter protein
MRNLMVRGALAALVCTMSMCAYAIADSPRPISVPPGDLATALALVSKKTGVELVFNPQQIRGVHTKGVNGNLSSQDAVRKLLEGTKLELRTDSATGAMMIGPITSGQADVPSKSADPPSKAAGNDPSPPFRVAQVDQASAGPQLVNTESPERKKDEGLTEIIVTGTHIHGNADSALSLTTIGRDQIDSSGYATAQELLQSLPQNFAALSFSGSAAANASALQQGNLEGAVGVDLRGLGPQSTLVLVNGERRAGALQGRVVDVSQIPLELIDHVDILSGGNSAIYGADAVAGVVNFVLRRSFDGVQTQVRYGDSSHEGASSLQFSQVLGHEWDRGGGVIAYDFGHEGSLDLSHTGLVESPSIFGVAPQEFAISPDVWRNSLYASGHFSLTDSIELVADAQYAHSRNTATQNFAIIGVGQVNTFNENKVNLTNVTLGTNIQLSDSWKLEVAGNYSASDTSRNSQNDFAGFLSPLIFADKSKLYDISAIADGALPSFGNVEPRLAIGGEHRVEEIDINQVGIVENRGSRNINSAFAELAIPLVHAGPVGLYQLDLTAAGRYDDYSDFGGTVNPQFSVAWKPLPSITLRGAYSRAFRAPGLYDTLPNYFLDLENFSNPLPGAADIPGLVIGGTNPDVGPERAKTWSVGIEFKPDFARGVRLYGNYYSIRYTDRLNVPAASNETAILLNPARYAGLINSSPTATQLDALLAAAHNLLDNNSTGVPFDPQTQMLLNVFPNLVVFDNRLANLSVESVRGIDFGFLAPFQSTIGNFTVGLDGNYTLSHEQAITPTSPKFDIYNDVGTPVALRLRGTTSWTRGPLSASILENFTARYHDSLATPPGTIGSWATFDLVLTYKTNESGHALSSGITVSLSASNIFARDPPEFLESPLGLRYDSANANALGRVVSLQVRKHW